MLDRLQKESGGHYVEKLPAVYALVFYHGIQTPYPYSLSLKDCFDDPHDIMQSLFIGEIPLVDLNQENDHELARLKMLGTITHALKHSRNIDSRQYMMQLSEMLNTVDLNNDKALNLVKMVLNYVLATGNTADISQMIDEGWRLPNLVRGEFMTIAEQLKAMGREEGRQRMSQEVVISLLKEGAAPRFAAKIAKVDYEEVLKIQQQLKR